MICAHWTKTLTNSTLILDQNTDQRYAHTEPKHWLMARYAEPKHWPIACSHWTKTLTNGTLCWAETLTNGIIRSLSHMQVPHICPTYMSQSQSQSIFISTIWTKAQCTTILQMYLVILNLQQSLSHIHCMINKTSHITHCICVTGLH